MKLKAARTLEEQHEKNVIFLKHVGFLTIQPLYIQAFKQFSIPVRHCLIIGVPGFAEKCASAFERAGMQTGIQDIFQIKGPFVVFRE